MNVLSNYFVILTLLLCIFIYFFILIKITRKTSEKYDKFMYDYDSENPNAIISGDVIAGTVYASCPKNSPGLGWIL